MFSSCLPARHSPPRCTHLPKKLREIPRIAILMGGTPAAEAARLAAFGEGLERLGYVEGRTVRIELHYVEGKGDRFGPMAREIVSRQPNVIVCVGRQEAVALQAATRTIPIVFMQVPDPVAMDLVATLARPGGNMTGFTQMTGELDPKRLELLREIAPSVSRAAFLIQPRLTPGLEKRFADAQAAAKALGIKIAAHRLHHPGRADESHGDDRNISRRGRAGHARSAVCC